MTGELGFTKIQRKSGEVLIIVSVEIPINGVVIRRTYPLNESQLYSIIDQLKVKSPRMADEETEAVLSEIDSERILN